MAALADLGWELPDAALQAGVEQAVWPGRFEWLSRDGEPAVIVDGAHNPHAARALAAAMSEEVRGRAVVLLVGFSRDKDVTGILEALGPLGGVAVVTQSRHPRAMAVADAAERAEAAGLAVRAEQSPAAALELAMSVAGPDGAVLATGSIFAAAEVREAWLRRAGRPMPPSDGPPP
jgi:dihydrofolate synthase/folylpolyglutamate synthase